MPAYAFLADRELNLKRIREHLQANRTVGVPYTAEQIENAAADLVAQASADADTEAFMKRYPKAQARDFDGDPEKLTEMDALVAYLQMLGTLVDFSAYEPTENER